MALTSLPLVFLTLLVIHESESTWTPTKPTLTLTCGSEGYGLSAAYLATSAGYAQSNDLKIGAAGTDCEELGVTVDDSGAASASSLTAVSYGTTASAGCSGTSTLTAGATTIVYRAPVSIEMTVTKDTITRLYIYSYIIECTLTRDVTKSSQESFTISGNVEEAAAGAADTGTFALDVTLEFVNPSDDTAQPATFTVTNKEIVAFKVYENTPASAGLKFTVQDCYASDQAAAGTGTGTQGLLVDDECAVDASVTLTADTTTATVSSYKVSTRAFTLAAVTTAHYVHCDIFVCLEAETATENAKCEMSTSCSKRRKRRSVVNVDELQRMETITSVQSFTIVDNAYTTDCPDGHVFDTLTNLCTQERVFKVQGVHLDKQWDPEYANTSSTKFQWFAKNTARELRSLILATGVERQIRGIKVIGAKPGSVILDVLITYGEDVKPSESFDTFKKILLHTTPQLTRLVNVLNVIKEKTVELVPVEIGSGSSLDRNLIIVIVFAVVAVAFISAIALYQVQKLRRRQAPSNTGVAGIDNTAMEKA